jgi:peptidoglycan/xylan/chitin deacetylase (PgdA/CDA1 family)
MSIPRIVTTSWDDGDPADLKVADLLRSRDVRGTFYVPMTGYRGRKILKPAGLRSLVSEGFEIGAHTLSHRTLSKLLPAEIDREVRGGKETLEDMLSCNIDMFCYPRGRYNRRVLNSVRASGYRGARTTRMLALESNFARFEMPTSLQVYPHSGWTYIRNIVKARKAGRLLDYLNQFRGARSWVELGKLLFDSVLKDGGVWHLYGHSWEIEELGLWAELAVLLDYVRGRPAIQYASNGEALKLLPQTLPQTETIARFR